MQHSIVTVVYKFDSYTEERLLLYERNCVSVYCSDDRETKKELQDYLLCM